MRLFTQQSGGWQRFGAPYYSVSLLIIATYPLARAWFLAHGDKRYTHVYSLPALFEKERFAASLLGMALLIKFWRRQSIDSFLSDALTYSKSVVALLVWYMDWRISIYYVILFMVCYLLFPQPIFRGAAALEHFTPASFKSLVEDNPQPETTWLVEFYAPWAPPCVHLEPVFAELSLKYTTPNLRFGKVDASRWPQLAKQHRVQVYGALPQLPTFMMFQGGKELGRIPHLFEDGSVANMRIRREDIIAAFRLDEFADKAKQKPKAAGSGSKSGGSSKKKR